MTLQPLFVGGIELFALVGIIILLFGASKILTLARSAGDATTGSERGKTQSGNERQRLTDELGTDNSV